MQVRTVRVPALLDVGTGASWGEGWWTAADLSLTHPRSPMQEDLRALAVPAALADELMRREEEAFLYGASEGLLYGASGAQLQLVPPPQ